MPQKLLWDRVLRHFSEFVKEGSLFQTHVQAIGEALRVVHQANLVYAEGEIDVAAACFHAGETVESDLLGKSE